eukprot:s520_g13.t1
MLRVARRSFPCAALKLCRLCRFAFTPFGQGSGSDQSNMAPSHNVEIGCHWMPLDAIGCHPLENRQPLRTARRLFRPIQIDSVWNLHQTTSFYPFDLSQPICSDVTCPLPRHAPCKTLPHLYKMSFNKADNHVRIIETRQT